MSIARIKIIVLTILGLACSFRSSTAADPSTTDPTPPIAIHGFMEEAKKLFADAIKDDEACTKLYQQMTKGGPKADSVGKQSMHVKSLLRLSERLTDLGEPAGAEFRMRFEIHEKERVEAFHAFSGTPLAQQMHVKAITSLQKNLPKRFKKIEEVFAKAKQNPLESQEILDAAYNEYESVAGILSAPQRGPFSEMIEATNKMSPIASAHRRRMVHEAITAASSEMVKELDQFHTACSASLAGLQAGKVTWDSKSLSGPLFINEMMRAGFANQARLQRIIALQHINRKSSSDDLSFETNSGKMPANGIDPSWNEQLAKLKAGLGDTAVKLIDRDTLGLNADALITRLGEYAITLGKYSHRVAEDDWNRAFDAAILKAATRVPEVEKIVRNYHDVTKELLKWKERFAGKQESILSGNTKPLRRVIEGATPRTDTLPGYFGSGQNSISYPFIYNSTMEALPVLGKNLGKNATAIVGSVVRLDSDSPVWISRMDNYIYARLSSDFYKPEYASKLKSELMIDDSKPPLSVRAASAVTTAERGDNLIVGGTINEVFAEGSLMRMISMKENAAPFSGIDAPVSLAIDQPTNQVSLRAAVSPKWYRHRYFVVGP